MKISGRMNSDSNSHCPRARLSPPGVPNPKKILTLGSEEAGSGSMQGRTDTIASMKTIGLNSSDTVEGNSTFFCVKELGGTLLGILRGLILGFLLIVTLAFGVYLLTLTNTPISLLCRSTLATGCQ